MSQLPTSPPTTRTATVLDAGDPFPALGVALVGSAVLRLPDHFAGRWGVVLFNRGSWCPYCNVQLRGFQRAMGDLESVGAGVVSLSVDDEETTQALVDKHQLSFPVGHSADADQVAGLTGAFVNSHPRYLQATGFVLDPWGRVAVSVYSSGAIGRIGAEDAVGMIRFAQRHQSV